MRRLKPAILLTGALALTACSSLDHHRRMCGAQVVMGLDGKPVAAPTQDQEACAQMARQHEEQQAGQAAAAVAGLLIMVPLTILTMGAIGNAFPAPTTNVTNVFVPRR